MRVEADISSGSRKMYSKEIEEMKKKLKLSTIQKEVLVGILLGDAHLETRNGGQTYRLKIEQSLSHKPYVEHLYEVFSPWVMTAPRERKVSSGSHESANLCFQTVSHGAFRFFAQQFYGEGQKIVPKLIHRWLTPRSLAYWYMDDGSIKSKESKGVVLNTQAFTKLEVMQLCAVLAKNFNLEASPRNQKEGQQIYISGRSYQTFKGLIAPYLIPEMNYKLPTDRKTRQTLLPKM